MVTRSYIGIKEGNHISYIYCHWDGYIAHNGAILQKSYQDEDKIHDLINLGDLSVLGSEIGEEHDFMSDDKDICTAYHRDRNKALNIETMGVRGKSFDEICKLVLDNKVVCWLLFGQPHAPAGRRTQKTQEKIKILKKTIDK